MSAQSGLCAGGHEQVVNLENRLGMAFEGLFPKTIENCLQPNTNIYNFFLFLQTRQCSLHNWHIVCLCLLDIHRQFSYIRIEKISLFL